MSQYSILIPLRRQWRNSRRINGDKTSDKLKMMNKLYILMSFLGFLFSIYIVIFALKQEFNYYVPGYGKSSQITQQEKISLVRNTLMIKSLTSNERILRDASGNYVMKTFIWTQTAAESRNFKVCLATHTTVNGLHWLVTQVDFFQGPISVSVFTPGKDIKVAVNMIEYLLNCHPKVNEFVSFHIIYPTTNPPDYSFINESTKTEPGFTCIDGEEYNNRLSFHRVIADIETCKQYPQNVARNLAWDACHSGFVLNVDIDMVPNFGLYPMLEAFVNKYPFSEKIGYILPVYEIKEKGDFPVKDKDRLIYLVKKQLARRYHIKVYVQNQNNSNLTEWETMLTTRTDELQIMYTIPKYKEGWEPIMLLHSSAPKFLEHFIGYGSTRNSHVYLLNHHTFAFQVLDKAFLCHLGFQEASHYPQYRIDQVRSNKMLFQEYKKLLSQKNNFYHKRKVRKKLRNKG